MDAVRSDLEHMGGSISIEFLGDEVDGFAPIQFSIEFPVTSDFE